MKSCTEIIKAQESIGNVEITQKQYGNFCYNGELIVRSNDGSIFFAPREVVHPEETEAFGGKLLISDEEKIGCGKEFKKYWNSKVVYLCGQMYLGEIILCPSCKEKKDNHSPQGYTNGMPEKVASVSGSDIQSSKILEEVIKLIEKNFKKRDNLDIDEWEEIKSKIKEKWGKIE
jgi:hypothetical protein